MNKIKILVTGSNGLLGQKISEIACQDSDIDLYASSIGNNRNPGNYNYIQLDITNQKEVNRVIDSVKPDVIINTAAMTQVDDCEKNHTDCDNLNVNAVSYLREAAEKNSVHLIHISTDFIFNGKSGPVDEEVKPEPLSYYGNSKWIGEQIVQEASCPWTILRTILVYGRVNNMSRTNIVIWAIQSLTEGKAIQIVDDQFRTPTLADDLALACLVAAKKKKTGIFHIGGPEFMSIYDLIMRICEYHNLDRNLVRRVKSTTLNQPAKRPPVTGFIIDKARRELDYNPRTFEEGLKKIEEDIIKINKLS